MIATLWRRLTRRDGEPASIEGPVDCAAVASVIQRYLDGELEGGADEIAAHLDACRACGLEAATYDRIKAALAAPADDDVDPAVLDRLRAFGAGLAGPD